MNSLAQTYRAVVPRAVRAPLWHARSAVWGSIAGPSPSDRRRQRAIILAAIGRPLATVFVNGINLRVDLRDEGVGRPIFVDREYEPAETEFLRRTLRPGMTFIDIGSNIGYFATLGSRLVGTDGEVIAFEPDPHNFGLLRENVEANRIYNVEPLNLALGAAESEMLLYRSRFNFGDHRLYGGGGEQAREAVKIKVKALDSVLESRGTGRVDVIKMDVQGFEYHVLEGMRGLFGGSHKPTLLTEFWPHGIEMAGGSPARFLAFFEEAGYSVGMLNPDGTTCRLAFERVFDQVPAFDPLKPDHSFLNLVFYR